MQELYIADFGTTPIFAASIPSTRFAQTWDLQCAFFSYDVGPVCNFKIERGFKLFQGGLLLSSAFSNYLVVGLNLSKLNEKLFSFHGIGKSFTRCWGWEMSYMMPHFGLFVKCSKLLNFACLPNMDFLYSKPEASLSRFQSNNASNNKYFWTDRQMIVEIKSVVSIWHVLSSALPSKISKFQSMRAQTQGVAAKPPTRCRPWDHVNSSYPPPKLPYGFIWYNSGAVHWFKHAHSLASSGVARLAYELWSYLAVKIVTTSHGITKVAGKSCQIRDRNAWFPDT